MRLFGRERERHYLDAWIQARRFQSTTRNRVIVRVYQFNLTLLEITPPIWRSRKLGRSGAAGLLSRVVFADETSFILQRSRDHHSIEAFLPKW